MEIIIDDAYFHEKYLLQSVWLGFIWVLIFSVPQIIVEGWVTNNMYYEKLGVKILKMSTMSKAAWYSMSYGSDIVFIWLIIFWLLAYIEMPKFQRFYFKVIVWMIPVSWIMAFWITLAFIIGGA